MLAGVTVVDPASTWIDVTVTFEQDAIVHPGTQLQGATHLAEGAEVGPNSASRTPRWARGPASTTPSPTAPRSGRRASIVRSRTSVRARASV